MPQMPRGNMHWLLRIIVCRAKQPAVVRWLEVLVLFGIVLGARIAMGRLHGANPGITFFPLLLIIALLFGWREATVVMLLAIAAAMYLFAQPDRYLLPVGWSFVGGLTIAIITLLKRVAEELLAANQRQRILFRELQHRVANNLQSVVSTLELALDQIDTSPERVKTRLKAAIDRFGAAAEVHRRLNDPTLFQHGLSNVLVDAVATVVDIQTTEVNVEVASLHLSFDQMSVVAMLVIEAANNAQKHVFARKLGRSLLISLHATQDRHARLVVKDDGPGWSGTIDTARLGMTIIDGLVRQIGGELSIRAVAGTEICVVFPLA